MKASFMEGLNLMCACCWQNQKPMEGVKSTRPENEGRWWRARLWLSSANHGCLWREQSIPRNQEISKDNQKEELSDPARQENPSLRAFLACMMEDHVGESLAWVIAWRMLGPKTYLLARRTTQSFGEDWIKSQTSFLRRQILASLAVLRPSLPWFLGRAIFYHSITHKSQRFFQRNSNEIIKCSIDQYYIFFLHKR